MDALDIRANGMDLPTKKKQKPDQAAETTATIGSIEVQLVTVEVPYVTTSTPNCFQSSEENRRCDLGVLSADQARKLRAIRRGYDYSGRRLGNGGEIKSLADAVRCWLDLLDI